jgi:heavy metal sensor kinase
MMIGSIRGRLTAWYSVVLAVVLVIAGTISYAVARRQILRSTDASMATTEHQFASGLNDEASEAKGTLRLRAANELLADLRDNERAIVLLTAGGREFAAHTTPLAQSLDRVIIRRRAAAGAFGFLTTHSPHHVRLLLMPARIGDTPFVVVVGQSLATQGKALAGLREAMLITLPIALLVASIGGYILARKSLTPVLRMSAKARAITSTNLSQRIEIVNRRDELGELGTTLNDLLARLDESFAAQRRFMADASHELRTPVAILQGEIDVTMSRNDRAASEYRQSLEVMRHSVSRLTRIVRDLFLLARSDAGEMPRRTESVYAGDLVTNTVQALRTVAASRQVTLAADCDNDVMVAGDEDLLQRMIRNLIENAIRYTASGTQICIHCRASGHEVRIEVRDRGAGVPSDSHERIFQRFFRVDPARSTTETALGSGAGLGLPIARWIAEAHGGTVRLEKSDAEGSVFVATLPLRDEAASSAVRDGV